MNVGNLLQRYGQVTSLLCCVDARNVKRERPRSRGSLSYYKNAKVMRLDKDLLEWANGATHNRFVRQ